MSNPHPLASNAAFVAQPIVSQSIIYAVEVCRHLSTDNLLDEETLTGSLLGSLSSALLVLSQNQTSSAGVPSVASMWARYNKKCATDKHSEAENGADFAMVLISDTGRVRLAVFQAKKGKVKSPGSKQSRWAFDINRQSKNKNGMARRQIVALAHAAQKLQRRNAGKPTRSSIKSINVRGLSWVHYVAYGEHEPICIPLNGLGGALWRAVSLPPRTDFIDFNPKSKHTFFKVMKASLLPKTRDWLDIGVDEVLNFIPKLLPIMPVLAAGDVERLTHRLGTSDISSSTAPKRATISVKEWKAARSDTKDQPSTKQRPKSDPSK